MRALIVGAGALGGLIAARLAAAGRPVAVAARDDTAAARLRTEGMRVSGVGGTVRVHPAQCHGLDYYARAGEHFDLVVLATKAAEAVALAPALRERLTARGVLLPIQNGGVAGLIARAIGAARVIGGLSNLGATMHAPGTYEQRNAGHLLIGHVQGERTDPVVEGSNLKRVDAVAEWLHAGVEVRCTGNFPGAVWSKLLLNCSVTTLGALAGCTMREYLRDPAGRVLFDAAYNEALAVALRGGVTLERMLVEPIPPGWTQGRRTGPEREAWLAQILHHYGDLKPSMLQDIERGRPTEVEFINGFVVRVARELGGSAPVNAAITALVRAITRGERRPSPATLAEVTELAGVEVPRGRACIVR